MLSVLLVVSQFLLVYSVPILSADRFWVFFVLVLIHQVMDNECHFLLYTLPKCREGLSVQTGKREVYSNCWLSVVFHLFYSIYVLIVGGGVEFPVVGFWGQATRASVHCPFQGTDTTLVTASFLFILFFILLCHQSPISVLSLRLKTFSLLLLLLADWEPLSWPTVSLHLRHALSYSQTMETACTLGTFINVYQTARRHNFDDLKVS
jgi:hypothetical protein